MSPAAPPAETAPAVLARAPGKVNLHLSVGAPRRDGYHELATVFLAVSIYDELTARPAERGAGVALSISGTDTTDVPADEQNLAWRAAQLLAAHAGRAPDVILELTKHIPVAAGLAGGSADAAAALVACDRLWDTRLPRRDLLALAAELGSDVAFCLSGGLALGTGRGERLTPVLAAGEWHLVLAVAEGGLSTPAVYAELDRLRAGERPKARMPDALINALRARDLPGVAGLVGNDLQRAALSLRPTLRLTLREGADLGAEAGLVSGSGPTCAFLVASAGAAVRLAASLSAAGVCRTVRIAHGPVPGARLAHAAGGPGSRRPG